MYTDQSPFTRQNSSKQMCQWILMREEKRGWAFFTEGSIIMDCGLVCWSEAIV